MTTVDYGEVTGEYFTLDGEEYYRVANSHLMPEFFVSVVSSGDHWMLISSKGALTTGRRNSDSALFPYYSSDKILDVSASTGSKTIVRVPANAGGFVLWEPFCDSTSNEMTISRTFYKNELGNKVLFEEVNESLELSFCYQWSFGNRFGFIRSCSLINLGQESRSVALVDGLQNLLPYGLGQDFQSRYSNLGDAYKKNELINESGLGIYYLSSIPTDRAEPNEGLRATTVWQTGLNDPTVLLSAAQLDSFRVGATLTQETDVRAHRGAYFVSSEIELSAGEDAEWQIIADVNQDQTDVVDLNREITDSENIEQTLLQDVAENSERLSAIISAADGRQVGDDRLRTHRHQSNVLFNVMRGGLPADGYCIDARDVLSHIRNFNKSAFARNQNLLETLPDRLMYGELQRSVEETGDQDLIRIVAEYLPFTFSRRHGDPTRP